jgi:hypothetical protein
MFKNTPRYPAMDRGQRHEQKSDVRNTPPFRGCHHWVWGCGVGLLGLIELLGLLGWGTTPTQASERSRDATRLISYGQLPLSFEANQGQTDSQVQFLAHGRGYTLFLTAREAVFIFRPSSTASRRPTDLIRRARLVQDISATALGMVRMQLLGANPVPQMVGMEELPGKANYFIGNDPHKWRTNLPTYAKVKHINVYPGVDLVYHGNQGQLEYDFVVQPGADPSAITLGFDGVDRLDVDAQGDLVLFTAGRSLRLQKPLVYQEEDGGRQPIAGGYVRKGNHQVGFHVVAYNLARTLVIDPVLSYATYLGGSDEELAAGVAIDAAGNAYVTGGTVSADFPTSPGAFQTTKLGFRNAFVTKLNTAGSALVYSTFLGGSNNDAAAAIAVDASGNAYVTGAADNPDFPTTPGAFQTTPGAVGEFQAFVTKLNPTGSALVYSTFLGGSSDDGAAAIAIDTSGNAYVTGVTLSTDFPTTPGAFQTIPGDGFGRVQDAFVSKLNAAGSALVYSTYLGATDTGGNAIVVDASGSAYVTGGTNSVDFPTTPGAFSESGNGFITKLNASGSALVYSARLRGFAVCNGIALDAAGNAYVTGHTSSPDFPTTPEAFQTACANCNPDRDLGDAFITKLNPTGSALVYSTFLGGSGNEGGNGITVDPAGNAYITGVTDSADFPTTADAFQTTFGGGFSDAFVSKLNAAGSALVDSTYLGGNDIDNGTGVGIDASGNAYVAGYSFSSNFPTTPGAFQTNFGAVVDAFVAKIAAVAAPAFAGTPGTPNCRGESVSALAQQFGGLDAAASALGFPSVQALQDAIRAFCER